MAVNAAAFSEHFMTGVQEDLRNTLVSYAISDVYTGPDKIIHNRFGNDPSLQTNNPISGTFTPGTVDVNEDQLTVDNEAIASVHIFDFEETLTDFNLMADYARRCSFIVRDAVDTAVFAEIATAATGASQTATYNQAGGTTQVLPLFTTIVSEFAGYEEASMNGMYLVIDNTHIPNILQAMGVNGFSMADMALKNGFLTEYMGVDIYVTRAGQLPGLTMIAGIKGSTTVALPTGSIGGKFQAVQVSGKTGYETATIQYYGVKTWTKNLPKVLNITVTV